MAPVIRTKSCSSLGAEAHGGRVMMSHDAGLDTEGGGDWLASGGKESQRRLLRRYHLAHCDVLHRPVKHLLKSPLVSRCRPPTRPHDSPKKSISRAPPKPNPSVPVSSSRGTRPCSRRPSQRRRTWISLSAVCRRRYRRGQLPMTRDAGRRW